MKRRRTSPGPKLNDRPFYLAKARQYSVGSPSFGPIPDQESMIDTAFSYSPPFTNPSGLTISFSIVGTLPTGLSINSSTGSITGTGTIAGTISDLRIRATYAIGFVDSELFDITISEVEEPIQTDLTHWSESDDVAVVSATSPYYLFRSKGTYTYPESASGDPGTENVTTALVINTTPELVASSLNGKVGLRLPDSSQDVREEWNLDTVLRNPVPQGYLYSVNCEFTIMWLANLASEVGMHLLAATNDTSFDSIQLYSQTGTVLQLYRPAVGITGIHSIDGNPHLFTIRCTGLGGTVEVFIDDDFTTPVGTMPMFSTHNANGFISLKVNGVSGSRSISYALMTYNRALTTQEMETNLAYLTTASRWGDSWL